MRVWFGPRGALAFGRDGAMGSSSTRGFPGRRAGAGPSGLGAFGYAREGSTTVVPWAVGTVLGRRAEPRGGRSRGWREGQDKPVPWDTQCEAAPPERERCERLFRTIPKIGRVPGAFTPRRPAPGTRRRSNDAAPSSVPVRM